MSLRDEVLAITGDKALTRSLEHLRQSVQTRLIKAAGKAGMTVVAKAIKREIPSHQKSARRAIGSKVIKDRSGRHSPTNGQVIAKAGAAVGMSLAKQRSQAAAGNRAGRKGVGISANNIHWLLAGTGDRWNGIRFKYRRTASGKVRVGQRLTGNKIRYTGRMPKPGYVQRAAVVSQSASAQAVKFSLMRGIRREAMKVRP